MRPDFDSAFDEDQAASELIFQRPVELFDDGGPFVFAFDGLDERFVAELGAVRANGLGQSKAIGKSAAGDIGGPRAFSAAC